MAGRADAREAPAFLLPLGLTSPSAGCWHLLPVADLPKPLCDLTDRLLIGSHPVPPALWGTLRWFSGRSRNRFSKSFVRKSCNIRVQQKSALTARCAAMAAPSGYGDACTAASRRDARS